MPPALDLRPAGHAQADGQSRVEARILVCGKQRPRADERHLADEDVEELRQLVQPAAAEKATANGQAVCVGDAAAIGVVGSRHGAELIEAERPPGEARPLLPKDRRRADLGDHDGGDQQEQGRQQDDGAKSCDKVQRALHPPVGTLSKDVLPTEGCGGCIGAALPVRRQERRSETLGALTAADIVGEILDPDAGALLGLLQDGRAPRA